MIFATVGTQLPFPRLIEALADLAPGLDEEIIAQAGPDSPQHPVLTTLDKIPPAEFSSYIKRARLIVSHAGIGTVLTAKKAQKPLIVMPRRGSLGEHRNDHQMATARQLEGQTGIHVAWDVKELQNLIQQESLTPATMEHGPEAGRLIAHLRDLVDA